MHIDCLHINISIGSKPVQVSKLFKFIIINVPPKGHKSLTYRSSANLTMR